MQFQFFSVLVFDSFFNGIPVAFIITSSGKAVDIAKWLHALRLRAVGRDPLWAPRAAVVDDADAEIAALLWVSCDL